jgi:WD repeat-containing protein 26
MATPARSCYPNYQVSSPVIPTSGTTTEPFIWPRILKDLCICTIIASVLRWLTAAHTLTECISPTVMLPENRLAMILQQFKQSQIDTCTYHTSANSPSLYADHQCRPERFPSEVALELRLDGEAWHVQFSPDGSMLAACGSTELVVIWDKHFRFYCSLDTHESGVGNVVWSPDSSMIVTCSQDKFARLWNVRVSFLTPRERRMLSAD